MTGDGLDGEGMRRRVYRAAGRCRSVVSAVVLVIEGNLGHRCCTALVTNYPLRTNELCNLCRIIHQFYIMFWPILD